MATSETSALRVNLVDDPAFRAGLEARLRAMLDGTDDPDSCWTWAGCRTRGGHGGLPAPNAHVLDRYSISIQEQTRAALRRQTEYVEAQRQASPVVTPLTRSN